MANKVHQNGRDEDVEDCAEKSSLQQDDDRHFFTMICFAAVSYTHLTLPTNREV